MLRGEGQDGAVGHHMVDDDVAAELDRVVCVLDREGLGVQLDIVVLLKQLRDGRHDLGLEVSAVGEAVGQAAIAVQVEAWLGWAVGLDDLEHVQVVRPVVALLGAGQQARVHTLDEVLAVGDVHVW
jgi:hypothetical protein